MGLFIARMVDPEVVLEPRTLLRRPKSAWEMHGWPVNEGPFIIENQGRTFLVFSGSSTFTPDYCLGIMGIDDNRDPMNPANWWNDVDKCVFYRNDAEDVFGPGHASFVRSPGKCIHNYHEFASQFKSLSSLYSTFYCNILLIDDTELWMIYHAHNHIDDLGRSRYSRAQKIEWNPDNAPRFPVAAGLNTQLAAPSGQNWLILVNLLLSLKLNHLRLITGFRWYWNI